ncbi:MAG: DUF3526 domain-containing protein [Bacteroidota bacterium]
MYRWMFNQFVRTPTCKLGLSLILILGIISIAIGDQFLTRQKENASQVAEKQQDHIKRNVELHHDDIGLLLYYLKFAVVNEAQPLAALSIGQKDVNPSVQRVSILTLEGQKYDTDLVNPTKLLLGNLDLSFLLIYVFPLLIIAFTYNLRSEEVETGTWRMVQVMSRSSLSFLLTKLSVRMTLLVVGVISLFLIASITLRISWDLPFMSFFIMSLLYVVFWFTLCFWIISFRRNSSFNALTLLSLWLVLVVLLPAALNNYMVNRYPVPEAFTTIIKQRDGYHQKWDTDKRETLVKFYTRYPQFESYGYPSEEGFNWMWYYAMQHLGDDESSGESKGMRAKILQRETMSRKWAQFIPSLHTQLAFNDLANTSLTNHMAFLQYLERFHEKTRLFFYPKIFSEVRAEEIDWAQFSPEYFHMSRGIRWVQRGLPLVFTIILFAGLALWNVSKEEPA